MCHQIQASRGVRQGWPSTGQGSRRRTPSVGDCSPGLALPPPTGRLCRWAHPGTAGRATPTLPPGAPRHCRPRHPDTAGRSTPALPAQAPRHCRLKLPTPRTSRAGTTALHSLLQLSLASSAAAALLPRLRGAVLLFRAYSSRWCSSDSVGGGGWVADIRKSGRQLSISMAVVAIVCLVHSTQMGAVRHRSEMAHNGLCLWPLFSYVSVVESAHSGVSVGLWDSCGVKARTPSPDCVR
jgi:hypothetical protein